MEDLIRTTG